MKSKYSFLPVTFTIAGICIFILLGNWQLKRMEQKNNFIKTLEQNISSSPENIDTINSNTPLYKKIIVSGIFLENKSVFLYGKRSAYQEKDGYYILSAFRADNGKTYLVSRVWIPHSIKNNLSAFLQNNSHTKIEAITLPKEKQGFFIPENSQDIWFTIDLKMAATLLGITETDYYLMQIDSNSFPEGAKPLSAFNLTKIKNDHLEYAITWYSFAICLFFVFVFYRKR